MRFLRGTEVEQPVHRPWSDPTVRPCRPVPKWWLDVSVSGATVSRTDDQPAAVQEAAAHQSETSADEGQDRQPDAHEAPVQEQ
jgi:hypothetical protein